MPTPLLALAPRVFASLLLIVGLFLACAPDVPPPSSFACGRGGPCDAAADDRRAPDATSLDADTDGDLGVTPGDDAATPDDATADAGTPAPDAAAADAAPLDSGLPPPNPACPAASPGALCDDFEVGMLSPRWTSIHATYTGVDCLSGGRCVMLSMPVSTATAGGRAHIRTTSTSLAGIDRRHEFYSRVFFRYDRAVPTNFNFSVIKILGTRPGELLFQVNIQSNGLAIRNAILNQTRMTTGYVAAPGQWHCVELAVRLAGAPGGPGLQLWANDRDLLTVGSTTSQVLVGDVQFTAHGANVAHPGMTVVIDDIAVDDRRITCVR